MPTLVDTLESRAERQPTDIAYVFLHDGEDDERAITYRNLRAAATTLAEELTERGGRNERALLLFPPGLDYIVAFFGCLYAGVVAVPAYPPQGARSADRLDAIVRDSGARLALTSGDLLPLVRSALDTPLTWVAVDADRLGAPGSIPSSTPGAAPSSTPGAVPTSTPGTAPSSTPAADDLAFLQYTSGSTRLPRGVMLTHANLTHNLAAIDESFAGARHDVMASWLPPYHDMGLIGAILAPMYGGYPAVLMSPLHFLQKPYRWLRAISRHRATISPAPNFAYELCLRRIDEEQRATLDLSSWRAAVNGAEPVRAETLDRFTERFAPTGFGPDVFRPSYGLAEATLLVSTDPVGLPHGRFTVEDVPRVACGTARGGQSVVVVDTTTLAPAGPGQTGEIWVSGPSVAAGYWGRPEESAALFGARLPDGRGPFLRTGDLGALDERGALAVTGRLKDLLILRGRNIYPHDVESAAERARAEVRPGCGAAFTVPVDGEEQLVLVCEVTDGADTDAVALACRQAVREECDVDLHELVLIPARTVPKTSSGKIQRGATRDAHLAGTLSPVGGWRASPVPGAPADGPVGVPPRDPLEALIAGIWAELLGQDAVGVHDDFFASGAQSVLLTQLASRLESELPVRITVGDLFQATTVARLAALLQSRPLVADEDQVADLITRVGPG
ncbi:AMP-binding protein [Streptomyces sp. NPDC048290]|uniref:AMP-binding protein n=1 Tax=Streptomyces sp. NPDC048290 TaxID=3155811 RepID=UPI003433D31B